MKTRILSIAALVLLALSMAQAQQPGPGQGPDQGPGPNLDVFHKSLFPPELVLQHQDEIGLNEEQRAYLKAEIRKAQTNFTDLQWKLQDEMEKLPSLIKLPHPDEQAVLAQVDRVLAAGREIKRAQIALLVRIKNRLTPEQQARLTELRGK